MKTSPSFKIFKFSTLVPLGITIAAALVTQPMRAGSAIDTLVITETSSTSLTATLNGTPLTVNNTSSDHWNFDLAGIDHPRFGSGEQHWAEPGGALGFVNFVQVHPGNVLVSSDLITGFAGLADGTPDTTNFALNGNPLSVTFFDKGDVATTPDTGTTASLFGFSLTGLAFLRRKL